MKITSIDAKFNMAQGYISSTVPYYMRFYNLFSRKAVDDKGVTLRVNMIDSVHPIVEYNTEFVDSLNTACLAVLLCAELNRILLRHCSSRRMPNAKVNYIASNIICYDPCIAELFKNTLETVGFVSLLPNDKNPAIREQLPKEYNHDTDCQLEILYNMLMKNTQQNGRNGRQNSDESDGGTSNGNSEIAGGKGNTATKENSEQETDSGKMKEKLQQHFNDKSGKQSEKWGENTIADSVISQRVNTTDAATWGSMPGTLRERIMAANRSVVDPRIALRNAIATACSDNMLDTRMKYNRRIPEWSGILPGKRHDQKFHLGIFADASGSMSQKDLELCLATVNDFIKIEAEVDFAWWDTRCEVPSAKLKLAKEVHVTGGGGTNPQCILDTIKHEKLSYDLIIVVTDCGFHWPRPKEYNNIFIIRTPYAKDAPKWVGKNQMSMKKLNKYLAARN